MQISKPDKVCSAATSPANLIGIIRIKKMPKNEISILSTRPLAPSLIEEAEAAGISIDELSFIETEPVQSVEVQQEIENTYLQSATVVFTSVNAVDAVAAGQEGQQPDWKIYCIGHATKQLVKKYFGEESIEGTADNATELAELITEESAADEVIFFCGDRRREELPDILRQHDIEVTEIVVYQTLLIPNKIEKAYHGILFFSPSAVESFFKHNKVNERTILFAIGNTTAGEIKKYITNKIIISDAPGKESLVRKMIEIVTPSP
jgi:uroporphyrinogen-III synthase